MAESLFGSVVHALYFGPNRCMLLRICWYSAMKKAIRKLSIQTYKAQLAMWEQVCATLSKELENTGLPEDQILSIGRRLDHATEERIALQFALDRLEEEERVQTGHLQP